MGDVIYTPLIEEMTWSFSRIKQFESCPYCWYLKYICQLTPDAKQFFASYGSFMHELLERFFSGKAGSNGLVTDYLLGFREKVQGQAPNSKIFLHYFTDGLACLRSLGQIPFRVLSTEQKMRFTVNGIPMVGFIDCIAEEEDGLILVDHKSRTLKPRSGRKTPTKSDEELDDYLHQLYLYAEAVRQERGVFPKTLCFNCFRQNTVIREPFDEQKYLQTVRWLTQMVGKIAQTSDFPPDWEYFKCSYLCDMNRHCEYHRMNSN